MNTPTTMSRLEDFEELNNFEAVLSDISDVEDPTYGEKPLLEKKKSLTDYFNVAPALKNIENPTQSTQIASKNLPSTSEDSTVRNEESESSALFSEEDIQRFTRCPYLDGTFFKVTDVKKDKLTAECQLCLPKKTYIKGKVGVSTNFLKHIRKIHPASLKDYEGHKKLKKEKDSLSNQEINSKRKYSLLISADNSKTSNKKQKMQ